MYRLKRLSSKPILMPDKRHEWEKASVFNAAAIYKDGLIHMFYRASDNQFILNSDKPKQNHKFVSSIGHAVSSNGIDFKRFEHPAVTGQNAQEAWGVEDPRLTEIDGIYYMIYTAFGGRDWMDFRISLVYSKDLKKWEGHRILLDETNKDAALLPDKIDGEFVMFHRREPDIWLAYSKDLKTFTNHKKIMSTVSGTWQSKKVGIAGPPIRVKDHYIMIYHAVDENNVYRLGIAFLDLKDPSKVIMRQEEPILQPELEWEKDGLVKNVVFSCGAVDINGKIYVYYGGGDHYIGAAVLEES